MNTTHDVRIWKTEVCKGAKSTSYKVRWSVAGKPRKRTFKTRALADSFRSKLMAAARNGESFDVDTGLPLSMLQTSVTITSWYRFACDYVDMKWRDAAPGHRRSIADALVPITSAMFTTERGMPQPKAVRKALRQAFNTNQREREQPSDITRATEWASHNSRPVSDLAQPDVLRAVLAAIETKLDCTRAAPDTIRLRRTTLGNALDYAIEKQLLTANPLKEVRTKKHKATLRQVDRRCVANPVQARTLLRAVAEFAKRLVAFFALMYFAGLRPEEATNLRKHNLSLPAEGWGEIHLEKAAPEIGEEWTDTGERSEERGLKHREDGDGRTVPCCPELTTILHEHLDTFGTASDGRLFWGQRHSGRLSSTVYGRAWAKARDMVFTSEVAGSPLAKRPYDLRHACVSTWLQAGVEATRVAEWAGHSVSVLLRVYAKCLDGGEQAARDRVDAALGRRN